MWSQSERTANFPIELLETLLRIMTSHEHTMAYFASLPGMTYQWARYTDWIKPLLNSIVASMNGCKATKDTAMTCLSFLDIYEGHLKRLDEAGTPEIVDQLAKDSPEHKPEE
jgi:hypothetical protein